MAKELLKGNAAMAEASIRAGLDAFFGYPITPSTEFLEHMAARMPKLGRAFVQAESEVAAINMVYGAACTGRRAMTASSSPGVSLMMEGLSYIAGTEVPMVLVDVVRGGPGLGNIAPAQSDYNQITNGGGHGDYHQIVLAPSTIQESIDLTVLAFDLAEKYRAISVVMTDGNLGQMMEPAELPPMRPLRTEFPDWAVTGAKGRDKRILTSIYINPPDEEEANVRFLRRWMEIEENEIRYKEYYLDDADIVVVGFGTVGRIAYSAVKACREEGIKVGLLRPITLSPFPHKAIQELANTTQAFLVTEMNMGQMLKDVQMAVAGKTPVDFYGRTGGVVPFTEELISEIKRVAANPDAALKGDVRKQWLDRLEKVREE